MPEPQGWSPAAMDGRIVEGEVQVWLALLSGAGFEEPVEKTVLSIDEQHRAGKFVFARDRRRFVATRTLLRRLLASYLCTEPGDLRFSYDRYGKPSLMGFRSAPSFNVSHSEEAAVFAISRAGEVGVDLEALRVVQDAEQIAAHTFARAEIEALRSLPPAQRERGFFNCWTRKEAFIKAIGHGLSHPLDSFSVTLRPGEPVRIVDTGSDSSDTLNWTLAELPSLQGYIGALAVRGHPLAIHYLTWNELVFRPAPQRP